MKYSGNQPVKILTGNYATTVGSVIDADDETRTANVNIFGVLNNEPVDVEQLFSYYDIAPVN